MSAADRLRALVEAATDGNEWEAVYGTEDAPRPDSYVVIARAQHDTYNREFRFESTHQTGWAGDAAQLLALAPSLAALLADAMEALQHVQAGETDRAVIYPLLARFDALVPKEPQ